MKTGLLTYHAAYNYGSALQALATQEVIQKLGRDVEIIDYRMPSQIEYYQTLYHRNYGLKYYIRDLLMKPIEKDRVEKMRRFESFYDTYYHKSQRFSEPEEVYQAWDRYHLIVSGSDQIWNKHSFELKRCDWKYMAPYLLKGFKGKKVSYATSIGDMTVDEINKILDSVALYDHLALRENVSATQFGQMLGRHVEAVLDPSLLLNKGEWIKKLGLKNDDTMSPNGEPYILYYTLYQMKDLAKWIPILKAISRKMKRQILILSPMAYVPCFDKRLIYCNSFGPMEFAKAILGADSVITDSFHGTLFSVNFNKPFYSFCKEGAVNFRKTEILNTLGIQSRIIYDLNDVIAGKEEEIDYGEVNLKLAGLREKSISYLESSING